MKKKKSKMPKPVREFFSLWALGGMVSYCINAIEFNKRKCKKCFIKIDGKIYRLIIRKPTKKELKQGKNIFKKKDQKRLRTSVPNTK